MAVRNYDVKIIHTGDDCSFNFPNETFVYKNVKDSFKDNEWCTMTIKSKRKPRSLPANAYMHLCMQMIADDTGNTLDAVKSTLKGLYARKPLLNKDGEQVYNKDTGEQVFYIQDTSDMDTLEAFTFTEKVRMFAIDFCGFVIPDPDENISLNFK